MSSFSLVFPHSTDPQEFSTLSFCSEFELDKEILKCGKLEHPIRFKSEIIEIIHFNDFLFLNGQFIFMPNVIALNCPENNKVTFSIIDPIPKPLPAALNISLQKEKDIVYYHIFYNKTKSSDLEYVESSSSTWNAIFKTVENVIIKAGHGKFGIKIGIKTDQDQSVVPRLSTETEFLRISARFKKRILIIVATSNKQLNQVPRVPLNFIYRTLDLMVSPIGKSIANLCRRAIYSCINGGIPLHLLDQIREKVPEVNNFFSSEDFDRICLDFSKRDSLPGNIEDELEVPLFNLKNHLLHSASEANLRSLFWDMVINQLFHNFNEASTVLNYRLESEWSTRTIFPKADDRFVDFVALMKVNEKELPILLIEAGKESFDVENSHKDFSKLLGLMSASCISLAIELVGAKKSPELARVYGIWIGGTQIQFCIAHPVLTLTDSGTYQLHANLTFCPHWKYDILSSDSEVSTCSCCSPLSGEGFESLITGKRIDIQILNDTPIALEVTEIDLEEFIQETETDLESFEASEGIETNPEVPSTPTTLLNPNPDPCSDSKLFTGVISFDVLKRLKLFIKCVIDRINLLSSTTSDALHDERKFDKLDEHWIFFKSRPSSLQETPESGKFNFNPEELQKSPSNRFSTRKRSINEIQIYWKLSTHDRIFPKLYNAELINECEVNFEFEMMIPLVDADAGFVCDLVFENRFFGSFVKCTTFAIHCLYSLYVLHESVGVIHSDISPSNILYSSLDNIWKLNDFDQSLEIEKSLQTPRTAGTQGFIAPESRQTGLFTKASDVFSLGKVIQNVLYSILLRQFIEYCGPNQNIYEEFISKYERAMNRMCLNIVNQRSTVISALNEFYYIFQSFNIDYQVDDLIVTRVPFILDLEIKKKKDLEKNIKIFELPKEFPDVKKSKFTQEDNQNIMIAQNILQNK